MRAICDLGVIREKMTERRYVEFFQEFRIFVASVIRVHFESRSSFAKSKESILSYGMFVLTLGYVWTKILSWPCSTSYDYFNVFVSWGWTHWSVHCSIGLQKKKMRFFFSWEKKKLNYLDNFRLLVTWLHKKEKRKG